MIVVILGPTGVGKSKLSIELAKKMNAEIINADATQVYKEVNIGVAKVTEEEKQGVIHHMLDIVSINQNYTVKDYQKGARKVLDKLLSENKNVIVVGGSGLYLKALLYDYKFTEEESHLTYDGVTNQELKDRVDKIYKENNIHVNNRKRLVRFLSHYDTTGEIIKNTKGKDTPVYDFTLIGLTAPKEELHKNIEKRVEIMVCDGLIEEARNLFNKGEEKAANFIGYKEFYEYFKHNINPFEAMDLIKKRTKAYAKRQYTWFRTQFNDVKWFNANFKHFDETVSEVYDYLKSL